MKNIKWGIIGSGKIARRFAADLALLDSAILVGSASRNIENNAEAQEIIDHAKLKMFLLWKLCGLGFFLLFRKS